MSISTLGAVARAAYHAEHPPAVNAWDAVAEQVAQHLANKLRTTAKDYTEMADQNRNAAKFEVFPSRKESLLRAANVMDEKAGLLLGQAQLVEQL